MSTNTKKLPSLLYKELQFLKKQPNLGYIPDENTAYYQNIMAKNEDWYRCIMAENFLIQKPMHVRQKYEDGYIQASFIGSKQDEDLWIKQTDNLFTLIINQFPDWETPDPIIRYAHRKYAGDNTQYSAQRQLRFTYKEVDKFLEVIPYFCALINANDKEFSFLKDQAGFYWEFKNTEFCKFKKANTEGSKPDKAQYVPSRFVYDYDTEISKFIKTLTSPAAQKSYTIKSDFDKFYKELFVSDSGDKYENSRWITEKNNGVIFVEDNIIGGLTEKIYRYLRRNSDGDYSANRLQLAKIFYLRLCSDCGVSPSADLVEVFYNLIATELQLLQKKQNK